MKLRITESIARELIEHATAQAPIEVCGYLAAKDDLAVQSIRLRNVDNSPEHFSLDPAEQFAALRKFRKGELKLRAVYHSHPASPARPSREDVRLAFDPSLSYIIVSLVTATPEIKSFSIRNGIVTPEQLEVVPDIEEANYVL